MYLRKSIFAAGVCLVISLTGCGGKLSAGSEAAATEAVMAEGNTEAGESAGSDMVQYEGNDYSAAELSEKTLEWLNWYQELPRSVQMKISYVPSEFIQPAAVTKETNQAAVLLYDAPELHLTDPYSSQINSFGVRSGSYKWSYAAKEGLESMIACGPHPLEIRMDELSALNIPDYNKLDAVPYIVYCDVMPDRIVVNQWPVSVHGSVESEIETSDTYEDVTMIDLKRAKIYEIIAEWNQDEMDVRGFYGTASYFLYTE